MPPRTTDPAIGDKCISMATITSDDFSRCTLSRRPRTLFGLAANVLIAEPSTSLESTVSVANHTLLQVVNGLLTATDWWSGRQQRAAFGPLPRFNGRNYNASLLLLEWFENFTGIWFMYSSMHKMTTWHALNVNFFFKYLFDSLAFLYWIGCGFYRSVDHDSV